MRRLRLSYLAWKRSASSIDKQSSQLKWRTSVAYYLAGVIHSSLLRLQSASNADVLGKATPCPPLFLLGFWRSGTTLLHELFCRDPQFGFASTYACLNPSHFLLTEPWAKSHIGRLTTRPMDAMSYSWASPQEDEFALLAIGAPSPYEALIAPSLMRESRILLDLRARSPEEQTQWITAFQFLLRLLTVQQGRALVLKSPPHGFKLPFLLTLFPQGRYVLIERNPYEVFASNLKLWRTLLRLYAVESWTAEQIEQFILEAYIIHEEIVSETARFTNANQWARVRYEDLILDPIFEMERLYRQLNIAGFQAARASMQKYLQDSAEHARNRFVLSALQKERLDSCWGGLIKTKEYKWPERYLRVED
jgi:omega-hydroxy-beta-dihydromenaquinone-9 sulfotransferase